MSLEFYFFFIFIGLINNVSGNYYNKQNKQKNARVKSNENIYFSFLGGWKMGPK